MGPPQTGALTPMKRFCLFVIIPVFVGYLLFRIHPAASFQSEVAKEIRECRAQLAADATRTDVRLQLAKHYLHIEAYEQAAAEYRHVIGTGESGKSIVPLNPFRGNMSIAAEASYGLGLASAGLEKFDAAIAAYNRALAIAPDWAHIHAALGSAYANTHRYEEALTAYNIAVELQPDDAMIHHHLGNVYSKRGKRDKAMRHQLRAIALAPALASAHYQLGRLYAQQKRWREAIAAYQTAYAHDAELLAALYHLAQAYRRSGDEAAAREQLARFEEQQSLLHPLHQLRGALQRTQASTERARILTNIGRLYLKSGFYERAVTAYQKAIGHDAQLATAYNGIGIAFAMQEKYPEALAAQQKALELQPDFAKAHAGLGFVYLMQSQRASKARLPEDNAELALKHYRRAVALEPQFLAARRKIGIILLNQKRYAEAAEAYQSILTLKPDDAEAYHNLGLCYAYQGQTEDALDALKQAVTLCLDLSSQPPFLVETYHLIGELRAAQGNVDAAASAYLASGLPKAYHALAQLYGKRGVKLDTAIGYAQKAIALAPNVASYYNTLALIAFRTGDSRQAETAIRKAVELEPENRNYREGLKQILKR